MASLADLFQAQIEELKEEDKKSQEKTKQTLANIWKLIEQLEAIN
jgi:hypothetical protein